MKNIGLWTLILSVLPISELRGAIPFAYLNGIALKNAFALGVSGNLLVIPLGLLFLKITESILMKISFCRRLLEKKSKKVRRNFEKYGYIGLTLFVAIPLPFTGAWTGLLGAWFLGLDKKKSSRAIAAGVLIAGLIVSTVIFTGSELASVFTKTITI